MENKMKQYKLQLFFYNNGYGSWITKGHHEFDKFREEVTRRTSGNYNINKITHAYLKRIPVQEEGVPYRYYSANMLSRGSFPATIAHGGYPCRGW